MAYKHLKQKRCQLSETVTGGFVVGPQLLLSVVVIGSLRSSAPRVN